MGELHPQSRDHEPWSSEQGPIRVGDIVKKQNERALFQYLGTTMTGRHALVPIAARATLTMSDTRTNLVRALPSPGQR
jgi:hypothetical protein